MKSKNTIILFLIFQIAFTGCNTENRQWEEAQKKSSIEGYEAFYFQNPNSEFSQKAIEEIWNLLIKKDSLDLFENFMNKHPDSKYSEKAMDEIWGIYKKQNTIKGYETFINDHPKTKYLEEAKNSIKTIWITIKPFQPSVRLKPDLSFELFWVSVPDADSYKVYWSGQKDFTKNSKNSKSTDYLSLEMDNKSNYGDRLNMYYKISAVKDGYESLLSEVVFAKLLPSKSGKNCQICGASSIGYCHLRDIYVCSDDQKFYTTDGSYMQCP